MPLSSNALVPLLAVILATGCGATGANAPSPRETSARGARVEVAGASAESTAPPVRTLLFGRAIDADAHRELVREFGAPPEDGIAYFADNALRDRKYDAAVGARWPAARPLAVDLADLLAHELSMDVGGRLWLGCAAEADARYRGEADRALALHFDVWETYHFGVAELSERLPSRLSQRLRATLAIDAAAKELGWIVEYVRASTTSPSVVSAVREALDARVQARFDVALAGDLLPIAGAALEPVRHRWLSLIGDCSPWSTERVLAPRASSARGAAFGDAILER